MVVDIVPSQITGSPSSKYEHRHCCVPFKIEGFVWENRKPIVSVTYENERKMCVTSLLCGKPLYREKTVYIKTHKSARGPQRRDVTHISDDLLGNMQLKLSFYDWCILILVICDWWISIGFLCFCVSRFVACDLIVTKTRR